MLRCESLLGLDQATCSRVLNKNYKLLVSMAPLSNEIRPISSCTPQVWRLEGEQGGSMWLGCCIKCCLCPHVCARALCLVGSALLLCPRSDLWLSVYALWALCLQLTTKLHKERERGREARLMSNSSAWPHSSFLAELRETEGKKLNSCCAIHAAVYFLTAGTQRSGIQRMIFFVLCSHL